MKLVVLRSIEEAESIREEWSYLVDKSGKNNLYLSYEWFLSSYESFHVKDNLVLLTVRDEIDRLKCVLPLVVVKKKYRLFDVRAIGFLSNSQNPENDLIPAPEMNSSCFMLIMDYLFNFSDWDLIDFRMLDISSSFVKNLQAYLSNKPTLYGVKLNRTSPYIEINCPWSVFWEHRANKFRKSMRNKLNRALHRGFELQKIKINNKEVPELENMLDISSKSWKHSAGTDLSSNEEQWRFYLLICERLGSSGKLFLWLLGFDGVPVAFEFHIEQEGVVYPIRADFNENYKDLSPGSVLEYHIISRLFLEKNIHEYHSCGHTYDYLLNWTDKTRDYINYEIFKDSFYMHLQYLFEYKLLMKLRKIPCYKKVKKYFLR